MNLTEAIQHIEENILPDLQSEAEKECREAYEELNNWLKELQKYRNIGTLEECLDYKIHSKGIDVDKMSKAILLLEEMPKYCGDCLLTDDDYIGMYCTVIGDYINKNDAMEEKDSRCPLILMPERKPSGKLTPAPVIEKYYDEFSRGWNGCLDEIAGKEKGEHK